jgi:hypothetical protein
MSTLDRIAYFQGRRDEVPNQELAHDLAAREDRAGIREITEALLHREPNVRSDCLKVLYEIGYLKPELVAPYAGDFLKLLASWTNRLVLGAMMGLSAALSDRLLAELPVGGASYRSNPSQNKLICPLSGFCSGGRYCLSCTSFNAASISPTKREGGFSMN